MYIEKQCLVAAVITNSSLRMAGQSSTNVRTVLNQRTMLDQRL